MFELVCITHLQGHNKIGVIYKKNSIGMKMYDTKELRLFICVFS